jgi:transposase
VIKSAYEAGFSGFHLHRVLEKNGIQNLVIHAAGIEVASGDKVKTDKRDSLKIATQLEANRLKGIHVPNEEREAKRAITRIRDTVVEHRVTVANQIKALLHLHGLIPPNVNKKVCPKWIESLKKLSMHEDIRYALEQLTDLWKQLTTKIKEIDVRMTKQAAEDHALEKVYRSAPGIGPVGARVLANELEDMSHFDNERQLFSYTGLTPSEHSSGGHIRKGHISRQGKAMIRKLLVLASWKAIQQDPRLKSIYERISARAGGKRAIIAIARRLIGHIRACFKKRCHYKPEVLAVAA